ncbi:hypothetical protein HOY82DRAFT_647199 [Tuber indicum]|nr:hypothetical protein HOY82DRAFT_647199 [Tuber indicum]
MDICLATIQGTDSRGAGEIQRCWEQLISSIHTDSEASGQGHPYQLVAHNIRRLGHRFNSEYIFPPYDLVQLLEIYANEHQSNVSAPTWVVDHLLEAGIPAELMLRILDEMYCRDKVPFQGTVRRRLVRDTAYVAEWWFTHAVLRGGGSAFQEGICERGA